MNPLTTEQQVSPLSIQRHKYTSDAIAELRKMVRYGNC